MPDWNLIKMQYEVFGASPEDLAREYGVSLHMISYAIEKENWKQLPVAQATREFTEITDVCNVTPELLEQVHERLDILRTIKKMHISPRYHALEMAILGKAEEIVKNLDATLPTSAKQLQSIVDSITELSNSTGQSGGGRTEQDKGGITLKILTQVGGTAVELTT